MSDITFLNQFGDVRINWDEEADDDMLPIIQKMMDEGITFWKIKTVGIAGVGLPIKRKVKKVGAIKDDRILAIKDEDFHKLVEAGLAGMVEDKDKSKLSLNERHKSAKSVVKHKGRTAAMKPLQGG